MISVAIARAIVLEHAVRTASEQAPLARALGRILRADVVASRPQPPFAASAMDGYAVRAADTPGTLRVVGEAAAGVGAAPAMLRPGEALRIFTGAPAPAGADSVIMQEDVARDGDSVQVPQTAPGKHIRAAGVDFAAGDTLLSAGRRLDGASVALAAAAGLAELSVARAPRIAVLSGGDELVPPGTAPTPTQIFDSVSYGVAGLARAWGGEADTFGPMPDALDAVAAQLDEALEAHALVVLIGGASVGERDFARSAASAIGAELLFEKVALRPGKPTWFAVKGDKRILGLPGNPASALVCARLFLRPLIARMTGWDDDATAPRHARLRAPLEANGARETYLRAITEHDENGQLWVRALANQDSSLLSVFAAADALIARAPDAPAAAAGDTAPILLI